MILANMEQLLSLSLFFTVIILFLTFFIFINIQTKRNNKSPPGPWPLPIIGNIHLLNFNKLHHSLLNLSNKYGPLMLLQLGSFPAVVVSSRDIAEKIFTNYDLTFFHRPVLTATTKIFYNNSGIIFNCNLDHWRQARKIATTELLSHRRIRSFEAVRVEEVKKFVAVIKDLSIVNMSELTTSLVNNIVCRATIGDGFGDGGYGGKERVWVHQLLSETQSLIGGLCVADYFPWMKWVDWLRGFDGRLEKNFVEMDKLFDRVIEEHLRKGGKEEEEKDFVHVLLDLHKVESLHEGGFLSKIDHVKCMLVVS